MGKNAHQASLFDDTEALPLFSGTAQRVDASGPVAPTSDSKQATWASCPTCLDVGKVGERYCWCEAGTHAREHDREFAESAARAEKAARFYRPNRSSTLEF